MKNEEAVAVLAEVLNEIEALDYGSAKLTKMIQRKEAIKQAISALRSQQEWIPFETRELNAEEKEEHPEWDYILCGRLPDDGQRILVNIKHKGPKAVQLDEYYDDGGECFLDSGYDLETQVTAWMPLPEPYREGE